MKGIRRFYVWSGLFFVIALILSVGLGGVFIAPPTLIAMLIEKLPGIDVQITWPAYFSSILFQVRLPHALLILMAGLSLGASGAAYQGVFRNPLADPYLLGVASGAGLGAVIAMSVHWPQSMANFLSVPAAAFLGALLSIGVVYFLSRVGGDLPIATLILAGVAMSAFTNALTSFLMIRSDQELRRALSWLLGGSVINGWEPVLSVFPYILLGFIFLTGSGHALNVLQFGEEQATQLGLNVKKAKVAILLSASLITAAAISFSGVIGFIGLIVPHTIRILFGSDYKHLIPLSAIGGSGFLLLADTAARTLFSPEVVPVGIITALAGVPFFLWLLQSTKKTGLLA